MSLLATLRVALASLRANRLRSVLATLGIVIGIAAVSTLLSAGRAVQRSTEAQLAALNIDAITILAQPDFGGFGVLPEQGRLTDGDATALAGLPNVARAVGTYQGQGELRVGPQLASATVLGVRPDYFAEREPPLVGRALSEADVASRARVAVLSRALAAQLFPDGLPLGRRVELRGQLLTVVGVVEVAGGLTGDQLLMVPLSTARDRLFPETLAQEAPLSEIVLTLNDPARLVETQAAASGLLRARHQLTPEQGNDFSFQDARQFAQTSGAILQGLNAFLGAVGSIALVVGGIGITNIMLVSVTERTREIGLRKAVGARRGDILRQFLIEALVLSLLGGLGGLALSLALIEGGAIVLHRLLPDIGLAPFLALDSQAVLLALAFASAVGVVAGLYPAIRASRLQPIVALRNA
jgi:putative ABC transport system permease protein